MTCEMSQFHCKLFIIIAFVCSFLSSSFGDFGAHLSSGRCLRPDGGSRGICKNLRQCEPLFDLLVKGNSRPPLWVIELLKRSHCGFEGKDPLVCCPVAVREKDNSKSLNLTINNPIYEKFLNKSCGTPTLVDKIFGGSETSVQEFPWMARIGYDTTTGLQFLCGGTLISHRYILTAAHCLIDLKSTTKPILVRLGDHDLDYWGNGKDCDECTSEVKDIDIEEIILHKDYHKSHHQHDIALIRLGKRVEFQNDIRPICLPISTEIKDLTNKKGTVTGWGKTESALVSPSLKRATLPIVSQKECLKAYRKEKNYPIGESQICAGGQSDQDSCTGDSGGPLQILEINPSDSFWVQYGIVSFGPKICGKKGMPGVYTRVSDYMKWIFENVKE